jgi:hypothetical protein
MKRIMLTGVITSVVIASVLPLHIQRTAGNRSEVKVQASVTGKVSPADAVEAVWVLSATDSVRAGISGGNFSAQVKPGVHKLLVDAKTPYRDVLLDNLDVKEKQVLDVGEIILQQ